MTCAVVRANVARSGRYGCILRGVVLGCKIFVHTCVLCAVFRCVFSVVILVVFHAVDVVHVYVTALDGRLRVDVDRNAIAATIFALFTHLHTPAARSALGHCLSQSA